VSFSWHHYGRSREQVQERVHWEQFAVGAKWSHCESRRSVDYVEYGRYQEPAQQKAESGSWRRVLAAKVIRIGEIWQNFEGGEKNGIEAREAGEVKAGGGLGG
jgi:hypothetical protein